MMKKYLLSCMLLLLPMFAFAKIVTGTVTDASGEPLIGVTVQLVGSKAGVSTNLDGVYSINVDDNSKVLKFSYVGMKTQTQKVGNQSKINVTMADGNVTLNEVVAIGYGSVRKKELTGAVAHVSSDDINNIVSSDLGNSLQGKVAGVNIVASSGAPGSTSEVLIRGVSSINGSNTPLYVVDGVPQEGDPRISTNEIETIDILKDAASCAIYGTRGAAGVILITTKQGQQGKLKVSLDASYGIRNITSSTPLMDTAEQGYFDLVQYRNSVGALDDNIAIELIKQQYAMQNNTDLLKHAIKNGTGTQNYSLNISGGGKNMTYNVVAGYYDEDGVIINSGFKRFNARANTSYKNKKWDISTSVGMTSEKRSEAPGSMITYSLSYYPYQQDITPGDVSDVEMPRGEGTNRTSWILDSFNSKNVLNTTRANASINANYEIIKGLKAGVLVGTNLSNGMRNKFKPAKRIIDSSTGEEITTDKDSYSSKSATRNYSLTFNASLNFKRKFGDHQIGAMAAFSLEEFNYEGFEATRYTIINPNIESLNGATGDQKASSYASYNNKLVGFIGRVQYDWKGRYLLSANIRHDGSSKFGEENRWGNFPSVSAAWNVSDEAFWKPITPIINNFKIRASYGTTGNQNFGAYTYAPTILQGFDYVFGNDNTKGQSTGAAQTKFANANVKWETTEQVNTGIDLYFLQNKITFSAEYYSSSKKDMLFPVTLPTSTGTSETVTLNVGNMTNKGVELSLGYHDKFGPVTFSANGTFSTNSNKVSNFKGLSGIVMAQDGALIWGANAQSQCTGLAEGYPAGAFFLYTTDGIIDTQSKLADYQKINPGAKMGDLIYKDNNNDGQISEADRVYCGSGLPEYEVGLNLNAGYKGFDLTMNWYAAIGHELINGAKAMAFAYGRHKDLVYAWSPQNPETSIPAYRGDLKHHANYQAHTDLWLEDGSYLRLKAVTLGYTLPYKLTNKAGISKVRVFATAQNPLTFTKYQGYDPEVGGAITSRGLDRGNYPVSAMYMLGLNVNF